MKQKKRLAINTVSNLSSLLLTAVLGFVLAPFILSRLGKEAYGVWAIIGSMFGYSSLLSLGLNSAVNRWVPMYLVKEDYDGINRVVNTCLAAYLVASLILLAAVIGISTFFSESFGLSDDLYEDGRWAFIIVGGGFAIITVTNVFSAILSGIQRYDLMCISNIATDLLRAATLVALLTSGYGLLAVASVTASAMALRGVLKSFFSFRGLKSLRINLSLARKSTFREMFGYSVNTLLYSCGEIIQAQSALLLVGIFYSVSAVPVYSFPLILTGLVSRIVTVGSSAIKPAATHLQATGDLAEVRELYLFGTKLALLVIFPITSFLVVFGGDMLRIWLNEDFMESSPQVLAILATGAAFRLWHIPGFFIVVGLGKHRFFGLVTCVTAICSLALASFFVKTWDLGVVGIAAGFAIPEAIVALFLILPYCCVAAGLDIRQELRRCLWPALVASVPFWIGLALAKKWGFEPSSYFELFALVLCLGVVVLLGGWFCGLTSSEKNHFRKTIWSR